MFAVEQENGEVHGIGELELAEAQLDDGHRWPGQDIVPQSQPLLHLHPANGMYREWINPSNFYYIIQATYLGSCLLAQEPPSPIFSLLSTL